MSETSRITPRLLGAHMPTAGGICNSLTAGKEIGCSAVQLFTGNPRQWQHPPLDPDIAERFRATRAELGIDVTVAHDSYLINLAAPDPDILERSRAAFLREVDRAEALGLSWIVTHMGAHLDSGEEQGLRVLSESLRLLLRQTEEACVGIALETTAGQGTGLGYRFEHIARVLESVGTQPRIGVCLDTCHVFAAGYDLRDEETYQALWTEFDRIIGLGQLQLIHANDAKKPLGSRVDRHEHIGEGEIGMQAFRLLVTDPRLAHIPILIETPEAETMHAKNLAALRRLAEGKSAGVRVTARVFGHYRDFGIDGLQVELTTEATVHDLVRALTERDPRCQELDRHCRIAVNEEWAAPETILNEGDEVAFIPPMSGG